MQFSEVLSLLKIGENAYISAWDIVFMLPASMHAWTLYKSELSMQQIFCFV